jgi:arginase
VITVVSAPTNLGLRPPEPGGVPGAAKAPEALREAGLHRALADRGAADGGIVLPGRYVDDDARRPAERVRNQDAIVDHARRLARRLDEVMAAGASPLVIGGDCSLVLAAGLTDAAARGCGLVHIDGHTDFRHPGNSAACASLAGEDLAAAIGLHRAGVADIDGRGPYFAAERVAHLGCRDDDEHLSEARAALGAVVPASTLDIAEADRAGAVADNGGYWLQLDVDVLDPAVMPAVDSPAPGGLSATRLVEVLRVLAPRAVGATVTVFDPDLDPEGRCAKLLAELIPAGLGGLGSGVNVARHPLRS